MTIEQHEKIVGNRFTLTHLIIKRTKELMNGARSSKSICQKFGIRGEIPNHLMAKIALEELRLGKLHWTQSSNTNPEPLISDIAKSNSIIFEG